MFHGSIVALVTPMTELGDVDLVKMNQLIEMHLAAGTDAMVVAGTTGESGTLNDQEMHQIIKNTVRHVNGKIPVIAGVSSSSTKKCIKLGQAAMEAGVDGCLVMSPPYVKPTQEGLYLHYKTIAKEVPLPIIVYNIPGRTACDILPETTARLAQISNIVALKDATSDMQRVHTLKEMCGDKLTLLSGDDITALDFIYHGGRGVISVIANIIPETFHKLCSIAVNGDKETANDINTTLLPLYKALTAESNPIPVKWALYELGLINETIRLPLTPLAEQYREPLVRAMELAGGILPKQLPKE